MKTLNKICFLSREHARKREIRCTLYYTQTKSHPLNLFRQSFTYKCTSGHPDYVVMKIIHLLYRMRVQQRDTNANSDDDTAKIIILRIKMRVQQRLYTWESGWGCWNDTTLENLDENAAENCIPEDLDDVVTKNIHLRFWIKGAQVWDFRLVQFSLFLHHKAFLGRWLCG